MTNIQEYCDYLNATCRRDDIKWIVGPHGNPMLIDDEEWSRKRSEQIKEEQETERQRHNHRIMNPI